MRSLFCFILVFLARISFAQVAISSDVIGGTPLTGASYTDYKGSAFLSDDFEKGNVIMGSGRKYENMELKLDLIQKKLIFKDRDGEGKYFRDQVSSFTLSRPDGEHYYEKGLDDNFIESLVKGNKPLWKATVKSVIENKPYGSAKTEKIINTSSVYYTLEGKGMVKFKNDKKGVLSVLSDKSSETEAFIKEHKLNPKSDEDLIQIFNFYNSAK